MAGQDVAVGVGQDRSSGVARPQLQSDRVAFEIEVAVEYELSVNGETAKVVEVDEAVGVGDALLLDDEGLVSPARV